MPEKNVLAERYKISDIFKIRCGNNCIYKDIKSEHLTQTEISYNMLMLFSFAGVDTKITNVEISVKSTG